MDGQDELLDFLCDGAAYGRPGEPVERIDTHAAHIFLCGDRAWKIKRPVAYSFLDFSTLAARRSALRAEYELNRRTAPALYLGVREITRASDGSLAIDGEGEAIEPILAMQRFDQAALLDVVATEDRLEPAVITQLARDIAAFHRDLPPLRHVGGAEHMAKVVAGNAEDMGAATPAVFDPDRLDALNRATGARLERDRALLDRRRDQGFVRHCHGDLHLHNIVMIDGRAILFDALEFDPAFAQIDTWYDLAFLIMDLLHRNEPHLAFELMQAYVEASDDAEGAALLDLFVAIRAAVRAKIDGFAVAEGRERSGQADDAQAFFALAERALKPVQPVMLALGGLSGTGKSTAARTLACGLGAPPGAVVLRSDVTRKHLYGIPPEQKLPTSAYTRTVTERVYARLEARAACLLEAGRSVIVDAVNLDPRHRAKLESIAASADVPFQGLWLDAPLEVLETRVAERSGDASDAGVEVVRGQWRASRSGIAWPKIDASGTPQQVSAAARRDLRARGVIWQACVQGEG
ncbi:MAG: AAA family ATPase [Geminicoccaceae bacterium]